MVNSKNSTKSQNLAQRKSRARFQCPPELQELIRQANLVPQGMGLPDFQAEIRKAGPEASSYETLIKITKHLPAEFRDYLSGRAYEAVDPLGIHTGAMESAEFKRAVVNHYLSYCQERGAMLWLVQRLETERSMMADTEKSKGLKPKTLTHDHFNLLDWDAWPLPASGFIRRGDDGKLHLTGLAGVIEKGFEDDRLRRCVICENIHWASREDSKTCSRPCLNKLNLKNFRKRTPEEKAEIEKRRKDNRNRNKKIKAKKNNNGTL